MSLGTLAPSSSVLNGLSAGVASAAAWARPAAGSSLARLRKSRYAWSEAMAAAAACGVAVV
jgi:hypothetical protein